MPRKTIPLLLSAWLATALALPAAASDEARDHPCVREAGKHVPLDKFVPESLSGPKAEIIEYADQRMMGFRFTLVMSPKGDLAMLVKPQTFECFTSEDRRRVLRFRRTA